MLKKYYKNDLSIRHVGYLIGSILIILTINQCYNSYYVVPKKKNLVRLSQVLSNAGRIVEINSLRRTTEVSAFRYIYHIDGKKYSNKIYLGIKFQSHGSSYLMDRTLPIVYEKDNPDNSWLLIKPEDFEYFDLRFPDSLNWIKMDVIKD